MFRTSIYIVFRYLSVKRKFTLRETYKYASNVKHTNLKAIIFHYLCIQRFISCFYLQLFCGVLVSESRLLFWGSQARALVQTIFLLILFFLIMDSLYRAIFSIIKTISWLWIQIWKKYVLLLQITLNLDLYDKKNNLQINYRSEPCLKPVCRIWFVTLQSFWLRVFICKEACLEANIVRRKIVAYSKLEPATFRLQIYRFTNWAASADM